MAGEQFTAEELDQIRRWADEAAARAREEPKGAYEQFYLLLGPL